MTGCVVAAVMPEAIAPQAVAVPVTAVEPPPFIEIA